MPVVTQSAHVEKARLGWRSIMGIGQRRKTHGKADGRKKRQWPLPAKTDTNETNVAAKEG